MMWGCMPQANFSKNYFIAPAASSTIDVDMLKSRIESYNNLAPAKYVPIAECRDDEYRDIAWGLQDVGSQIKPMYINRPKVRDHDVKMEVHYCGVCHSDLKYGLNLVGGCTFPLVPGHEFVGEVVEVGSKVTKVKVGDYAGVGVLSDSCLKCQNCDIGDEQYCHGGKQVSTYNDRKRYDSIGGNPESMTMGGYSATHVSHEHFTLKIPDGMPLAQTSPILCAGATMYDPLKHWGATTGEKEMRIGIIGIGGLGAIGVKIAKALGHKVTAISLPEQEEMALNIGADEFINSRDPASMEANKMKLDLILNTLPVNHQVEDYMTLLDYNGTTIQLGLVTGPHVLSQLPLVRMRKTLAGSHLAGITSTQEVLELCAHHNIYPDVQTITADQLDMSWNKLLGQNKEGIRYVLDVKESLKKKECLPAQE